MRSLLPILLGLAAALPAQDVRELSTPTGHYYYGGVSAATLSSIAGQGYRLVDLEVRTPTSFDATFVQNTGSYQSGWWWYYGLTAAQVSSNLTANSARLIDLEAYDDGNGNLRFACVMEDNTGSNNKPFWWYYGLSSSQVATNLTTNNARLVDIDSYEWNGSTYYDCVMIRNTGADARSWWYYLNVTPATISNNLSTNNAQLYHLDRRDNGNFNCIMLRNPTPAAFWWYYGLSLADVTWHVGRNGMRLIDIESYVQNSVRRYAIVGINNSNALTTDIGSAMRARTNGNVGAFMERIDGGNLVSLNGETQFEPASTMKTLHHTHAMRRVLLGATTLSTLINVYTNYSPTNASCPIDSGGVNQSLQNVLRMMMEDSDNARTQAVAAYFGVNNINNTAAALGMTGTSLNHRIGCAADAIANPNRITLRDLHTLHEAVANGYLGSFRDTYYTLMLDSVFDLSVANVIAVEAAALNLPITAVTSFRNFTQLAHKGGNYSLSSGGPLYYHRAEYGWISLPFITNDVITPREYSFGAFVNDADNDAEAGTAIYTDAIPEMLRPTIRQALQSWTNSLAGVISFGAGCGTPTPYAQTVTGLPRIGTSVTYRGNSGFANSLAVLGIGFSSTSWAGVPLPASLVPYGSAAGCVATNDIVINEVTVAGATGQADFSVSLPSNPSLVGVEYLTQCYTFGPSNFRTSNSYRSIVGF
ncbi:MAG: serine hydrolase [Planctomycetes bacterium]|nr:serine hydrolase [Planctomycetota bacterium]